MSVALHILDQTTSGQILAKHIVHFPVQSITVQQLIETRVCQEVQAYNETKTGEFNGLVQPSESERMLNGYRLARGKRVDVEKQKRIAIEAFESNGFFLLVNDQQVTELDDVIVIMPNTLVSFLKLVPLVGG